MLEKESDTFKKNNKQYFDFEIIRQKIKETMENKRITQTELGKITGIRQSRISNCLNKDNKAVFTLEEFYKICHTLGLSADDMMGLSTRTETKEQYDEKLLSSLLNVIADCVLHDDIIGICINGIIEKEISFAEGESKEIKHASESITFSLYDKLYGEKLNYTTLALNGFLGSIKKFTDLYIHDAIDRPIYETLIQESIKKAENGYKEMKEIYGEYEKETGKQPEYLTLIK